MDQRSILSNPEVFSERLFEKMKEVDKAITGMELYEFRYALNHLHPDTGWDSVSLQEKEVIEGWVASRDYYSDVRIKDKVKGQIVLDEKVVDLTRMLFAGLVVDHYEEAWVTEHFYFDVRGFIFLHRTEYFSETVLNHLGGKPFRQFEHKQKAFDNCQDIGYKAFKVANRDVDELFIKSVQELVSQQKLPLLFAIAGPTAAGKTEIVERLRTLFEEQGKSVTSIELDNFLTDRDYREEKGIFTQGKQAYHFDLFTQSLRDILQGKTIRIPRYDFVYATSSHDLDGELKPDGVPIEIQPADIIFIEGNFPFLYKEVADLISIKVVYLTDDPIRMKRKWKRDIDYRKKYDPKYFCNRYFKDQFIMAEIAYRPQMALCDIVVDTTGASLWTSVETGEFLSKKLVD